MVEININGNTNNMALASRLHDCIIHLEKITKRKPVIVLIRPEIKEDLISGLVGYVPPMELKFMGIRVVRCLDLRTDFEVL